MTTHHYAQQLRKWIASTPDKTLLAITHDRKCCDAMGAVMGFAYYAKQFGKDVTCIFARPHSQPMSERLYAEVIAPNGIMVLGEELEEKGELEKIIAQSTTLFALDTSSMQNSTYLPTILGKKQLKLYCIDHHEAGFEDIAKYPGSDIIRVEEAQSASCLITNLLRANNALPNDQETLIALYMGMYQDTIMIPPAHYSSLTTDAFAMVEARLLQESRQYITNLKSTPYPAQWQQYAKDALFYPTKNDSIVVGLGIIDNPGVVAYVADKLLAHGISTTIVMGLAEERVGTKVYRDLVASGRSNDSFASQLPTLFGTVFYIESNGRIISKGGGKITGTLASCAANIPLNPNIDVKQQWLTEVNKRKQELLDCNIPNECMTFYNGKDNGKTTI